ncbi:MAG: glutamine synthetase III [Sedimentisphaerales bacterium]|nr:glutamine synthetase III [Sedimentisphaerales bacterium]
MNANVTEVFGSNVFNDAVMRQRLPKNIYRQFKKNIEDRRPLESALADVIANAMKDWAVEKGATHFCHWFQPMTGLTAEKHDAFIAPTPDGRTIMEFSGKELTRGEPDASSFPSGGLRATFEARGYTAWDCTSPVFVKTDGTNTTLYIPCAFCSYTGEALDKKTPLLRSMDALDRQAIRVLHALGQTGPQHVTGTLGPEQEYFLVDQRFYEQRLDLVLTGRTLFGAASPRGQELEDHYFGALHERVASFMSEVNTELWKLGVSAKTQHNEVAPAQYEIAPVFESVNVATDNNQLTMETLRKVALRHRFACLLHEKPFKGVNGSGKHNNWSLVTDTGRNLLDPGDTPHDNMVFLVFLCAVIRAVDKYARLLRASVANAGNEHRLGANEAPPAIVSIFLGDQLNDIFEQLAAGGAKSSRQGGELKLGVSTLPPLPKDCTDRNRTSPFAFTGNKFEFRMVGSTQSTSGPTFVLNTIVADILSEIADELEQAKNMPTTVQNILHRIAVEHKRIVFNGDNYSPDWITEAKQRGLPNMVSTAEALLIIMNPDHVSLFERHGVLTEPELHARTEILFEAYNKAIQIEARTMIRITRRQILPACIQYAGQVATSMTAVKAAGEVVSTMEKTLTQTNRLLEQLGKATDTLEQLLKQIESIETAADQACHCRDMIIPSMNAVREAADSLEMIVDSQLWPLPTYSEMLFLR